MARKPDEDELTAAELDVFYQLRSNADRAWTLLSRVTKALSELVALRAAARLVIKHAESRKREHAVRLLERALAGEVDTELDPEEFDDSEWFD